MIAALQSAVFDLIPEGVLYRDIRAFIRLRFISVVFSYCPSVCNKLAHDLAALGLVRQETRSLRQLPSCANVRLASTFAEPVD